MLSALCIKNFIQKTKIYRHRRDKTSFSLPHVNKYIVFVYVNVVCVKNIARAGRHSKKLRACISVIQTPREKRAQCHILRVALKEN